MNVTWILNPDAFPDYCGELVAEIESQGHVAKALPPLLHCLELGDTDRLYAELASADRCVVCHASFEFTELVGDDELWTPGVYGHGSDIDCSSYFPHFSGHLLNEDGEFLPCRELALRADLLFNSYAAGDRIFVRPDSGAKPFTGGMFSRDQLKRPLPASPRLTPDSLLLVSRPKDIRREWRFVVVDRKVVAASMYKQNRQIHKSADVSAAAYDFAARIAAGDYQPDRVWVLDTCETEAGDLFVLEVNSFSNSNWYCCDVKAIVASVSRVALEDWSRGQLQRNRTHQS